MTLIFRGSFRKIAGEHHRILNVFEQHIYDLTKKSPKKEVMQKSPSLKQRLFWSYPQKNRAAIPAQLNTNQPNRMRRIMTMPAHSLSQKI